VGAAKHVRKRYQNLLPTIVKFTSRKSVILMDAADTQFSRILPEDTTPGAIVRRSMRILASLMPNQVE
jgi:hypothetical protein